MDRIAEARMNRRLSALERRLSALFRTGRVIAVQARPPRVTVDIGPDEAGRPVPAGPMPFFAPRAGETREWTPPDVGEAVGVLSPGGEDTAAFALPALWDDAYPPPADAAGDVVERWDALGKPGTEVGHTRVVRGATAALSRWELVLGPCVITAHGDGRITATNGNAGITIDSTGVHATGGALTHGGVNVGSDHVHSGVRSGGSNTGGPQ